MDREIHIFSSLSDIFVTNKSIKIKSRKGKRLTLLSLSSYTYFKATTGLKYSLVEERLLFSPARGLSNEFISDEASLDIEEGILLIIKEI